MTVTALRHAPSPFAVYGSSLRRAAAATRSDLTAVDHLGRTRTFAPSNWYAQTIDGDDTLLSRCDGPTLDVGCGPGRLTATLAAHGRPALGIDISADAIRLARRRGARVLRRDVFTRLPDEGRWRRVLLADGNIGINGDPERLLRRCAALTTPDGQVLVELDRPGTQTWIGDLRIAVDGGALSAPFRWAYVSADDLDRLARSSGLRILDRWTKTGRWFASLSRD